MVGSLAPVVAFEREVEGLRESKEGVMTQKETDLDFTCFKITKNLLVKGGKTFQAIPNCCSMA